MLYAFCVLHMTRSACIRIKSCQTGEVNETPPNLRFLSGGTYRTLQVPQFKVLDDLLHAFPHAKHDPRPSCQLAP